MARKDWDIEELKAVGAIGIHSIKPNNLKNHVHKLFDRPRWKVTDEEYTLLLPSLRLATYFIHVSMGYICSFLPSDPLHDTISLAKEKRVPKVQWYVVPKRNGGRISAPDLKVAREELDKIADGVSWEVNYEMFRQPKMSVIGITNLVPQTSHPWSVIEPHVTRAHDEEMREKGRERRELQVGIMGEYVEVLREKAGDMEESLRATFEAAITITHEVAHCVWHADFRSYGYGERGEEPYVFDDAWAELGFSLVGWIFSGWNPTLFRASDWGRREKNEGKRSEFEEPLVWQPQPTVKEQMGLYVKQFAIGTEWLEMVQSQGFWDGLGDVEAMAFFLKARKRLEPVTTGRVAMAVVPEWDVGSSGEPMLITRFGDRRGEPEGILRQITEEEKRQAVDRSKGIAGAERKELQNEARVRYDPVPGFDFSEGPLTSGKRAQDSGADEPSEDEPDESDSDEYESDEYQPDEDESDEEVSDEEDLWKRRRRRRISFEEEGGREGSSKGQGTTEKREPLATAAIANQPKLPQNQPFQREYQMIGNKLVPQLPRLPRQMPPMVARDQGQQSQSTKFPAPGRQNALSAYSSIHNLALMSEPDPRLTSYSADGYFPFSGSPTSSKHSPSTDYTPNTFNPSGRLHIPALAAPQTLAFDSRSHSLSEYGPSLHKRPQDPPQHEKVALTTDLQKHIPHTWSGPQLYVPRARQQAEFVAQRQLKDSEAVERWDYQIHEGEGKKRYGISSTELEKYQAAEWEQREERSAKQELVHGDLSAGIRKMWEGIQWRNWALVRLQPLDSGLLTEERLAGIRRSRIGADLESRRGSVNEVSGTSREPESHYEDDYDSHLDEGSVNLSPMDSEYDEDKYDDDDDVEWPLNLSSASPPPRQQTQKRKLEGSENSARESMKKRKKTTFSVRRADEESEMGDKRAQMTRERKHEKLSIRRRGGQEQPVRSGRYTRDQEDATEEPVGHSMGNRTSTKGGSEMEAIYKKLNIELWGARGIELKI